jgi:hypothetical protein
LPTVAGAGELLELAPLALVLLARCRALFFFPLLFVGTRSLPSESC